MNMCSSFIVFKNFFNVLFFIERERQSVSGGGAERVRHRIGSRLQAPSCQHRARHGAQTHELRDYDLSQSRMHNRLSHPGTPFIHSFNKWLFVNYSEATEKQSICKSESLTEVGPQGWFLLRGSHSMCMESSRSTGRGVGWQLWCCVGNISRFWLSLRNNIDKQFWYLFFFQSSFMARLSWAVE